MHPSLNQIDFVAKGWGSEIWHRNTELYCGKTLNLDQYKKLSLHYHLLKDETFLIVSGRVQLICYDDASLDVHATSWESFYDFANRNLGAVSTLELKKGDTFHIPVGRRHTLFGMSVENSIIEFSTQHFDSDSYRILKGD